MNSGTMSDQLREAMNERSNEKSMPKDMFLGQFASTVRSDQDVSGASREYVWYDPYKEIDFDAPDEVWESSESAIKIYGNWNEYAQGQDESGAMYLPDEKFPFKKAEDGSYVLDESTLETTMQDSEYGEYQEGRDSAESMTKNLGGQGASQIDDLLEKLGQYMYGGKIRRHGGGGESDDDNSITDGRRYRGGGKIYKRGGRFPDLNRDGKITMADILKGRGVIR